MIFTTISFLSLSHPFNVWVTKYEVLPTDAVLGVGAVPVPKPPVAVVYQRISVPIAVRATAVVVWQYSTGVMAAGGAGGFTNGMIKGPWLALQLS